MRKISTDDLLHIYNNTEGLWNAVKNKRIFITGGTGFFGKWILESFLFINNKLSLNAHMCVLSRDPASFLKDHPFFNDPCITFIKGDIQSFQFPQEDYHFVIHAATESDAKKNTENLLLMIDTITVGTKRVFEFARQKSIESVLFTSSGAIYGKQPSNITHIKEGNSFSIDLNTPLAAYAEAKRLAEIYCSIYYSYYNLPVKIARCFAFLGPHLPLDKHFAIGNFIKNVLDGEDIVIKGDGKPYRSYLYSADLTIWLWTILLKGENDTPYNVGSDEDYDLKTVANFFKDIEPAVEVKILSKADPDKSVERYVPDISFVQQELGLKVQVGLLEAIKKTMLFYKR